MLKRALAAAAVLLTVCTGAEAENRPKIGLTLSGGGAKGAAHIGVLKVMEEVGIPIDCIAGTSMGSIIGGLYAIGYSPTELEEIISSVDWDEYMSDNIDRSAMTYEMKMKSTMLWAEVPFNKAKDIRIKDTLPSGFISGNNILNLFNSLCVGYGEEMDFNKLPIPFACVATDIVTGEQVNFRCGILAKCMRASMAIPGVFAPVRMGDKVLIDGGIQDNFPVDVCKEMGADIVIGVSVSNRYKPADEVNSLPQLAEMLSVLVTQNKVGENKELCRIFIHPDMDGFSSMSFDNESIATIIRRGYEAADAQRDEFIRLRRILDRLGVPKRTVYRAPKAKNITPYSGGTIKLSNLVLNGLKSEDVHWLLHESGLDKASEVNGSDIRNLVSLCYGTGAFSSVTYNLEEYDSPEGPVYALILDFVPAQPHNVGFSGRFDSQSAASLYYRFGFNENRLSGGKAVIEGSLGSNNKFRVQLTHDQRDFFAFNVSAHANHIGSTVAEFGHRNTYVTFNDYGLKAYASHNHTRNSIWELGAKMDGFKVHDLIHSSSDPSEVITPEMLNGCGVALFSRLVFDNLDDTWFATSGVKAKWDVELNWNAFDNKAVWGNTTLGIEYYHPVGERLTFIPQFYGRAIAGNADKISFRYNNYMGGPIASHIIGQQLPFIGINRIEAISNIAGILRADLRWNVAGEHYLTLMSNWCHTFDNADNYYGAGIRASYNSLLGPVCLDFLWSSFSDGAMLLDRKGKFGLYFSFGYNF